jgi:small GTP-binding protein
MGSRTVGCSVKTVMVGDSGVGKTCLLTRYVREYFDDSCPPTLGVEFLAQFVDTPKRRIELQLWDTAGQELFRSVTRGYYRNSAVAYLVFDLASRASFLSLDGWLADIRDVSPSDVIIVVLGNKNDLVSTREVTRDEIQKFKARHKVKYFEVSAKTGENLVTAITSVVDEIDERADRGDFQAFASESIVSAQEPESRCCWT